MSICCAINDHTYGTVIGSDNAIEYGGQLSLTIDKKWTIVGNEAIASVGTALSRDLIEHYKNDILGQELPPFLVNKKCLDLFKKNGYSQIEGRGDPSYLNVTMMYATPNDIYQLNSDGSILKCYHFCAIGSGCKYSYGAYHTFTETVKRENYDETQDYLIDAIEKSISAACEYQPDCRLDPDTGSPWFGFLGK